MSLKTIGNILIIIGAIMITLLQIIVIWDTYFLWLLPGAIIIIFAWVNRNLALKGYQVFIICGIVFSVFTNILALVGYILLLVNNYKQK